MKVFDPELFRGRVVKQNGKIYISSTSVEAYTRCPMQCYYNRVQRLVLKGGIMPAALLFGSAVHSTLEKYMLIRDEPEFEKEWLKYENTAMEYTKYEESFQELMRKGKEIIRGITETLEMLKVGSPYTYRLEGNKVKNTLEVQDRKEIAKNIILVRTMDALVPVDGVPTVIDFKTSARMYSEGLQDSISEQLTAYSIPHSFPGVPQPEQVMFIVGTKTKSPNAAAFPAVRSERRQELFIKDAIKIAKLIDKGHFFHNRSPMNCGSEHNPGCDYRPLCYSDDPDVIKLYYKRR